MMSKEELQNMITLCQTQIKEMERDQSDANAVKVIGLADWIQKLSFCKKHDGFKLLLDRDSGDRYWIRNEGVD